MPLDHAPLDEILTPRQIETLRYICDGTSTNEIAHHLRLSFKTVETHRASVMKRTGITPVAELLRYAIRVGLIEA